MRYLIILSILFSVNLKGQNTAIPDSVFEARLINLGLDIIHDGQVPTNNIDTLTSLDFPWGYDNVKDLTGIEDFIMLKEFHSYESRIDSIDFSMNTNLESITLNYQWYLTYLNLQQNINIKNITIENNFFITGPIGPLTSLDLTQNINLEKISIIDGYLTSFDMTQNINLDSIHIIELPLNYLDVSNCPSLSYLTFMNTNIDSLDVSYNPLLNYLSCDGNPLNSLDVSNNPMLTSLTCTQNWMYGTIDVSQNPLLEKLQCNNNMFNELDVSQNPNLTHLSFSWFQLYCLNIANGNNLNMGNDNHWVNSCNGTPTNLTCIEVDDTTWTASNWPSIPSNLISENCSGCIVGIEEIIEMEASVYPNPTTGNFSVDLGELKRNVKATLSNSLGQIVFTEQYSSTALIELTINAPAGIYFLQLETANESKTIKDFERVSNMRFLIAILFLLPFMGKAQVTLVPDTNFEQRLIDLGLDTGTINSFVPTSFIDTAITLQISGAGISDMTGIQDFLMLEYLFCQSNVFGTIDLSQNIALKSIVSFNNSVLTALDLSQNPNLEQVNIVLSSNLWCVNVKNGNNTNITNFRIDQNTSVTCIEVDDYWYSTNNWTAIDSWAYFGENCGNNCAVGIEEIIEMEASIYPNPTTGNFTVDLGEVKSNVKATLSNSLGQIVFTEQYTSTALIELTIQAPAGIYFLQLETANESKIIKILKE